MNFIINPVNNKQYSIQSKDGKQLLKNYINFFLKKEVHHHLVMKKLNLMAMKYLI